MSEYLRLFNIEQGSIDSPAVTHTQGTMHVSNTPKPDNSESCWNLLDLRLGKCLITLLKKHSEEHDFDEELERFCQAKSQSRAE